MMPASDQMTRSDQRPWFDGSVDGDQGGQVAAASVDPESDLTDGIEALRTGALDLVLVSQRAAADARHRGDEIDQMLAEMRALRGAAVAA
jgi:hypothetical protein